MQVHFVDLRHNEQTGLSNQNVTHNLWHLLIIVPIHTIQISVCSPHLLIFSRHPLTLQQAYGYVDNCIVQMFALSFYVSYQKFSVLLDYIQEIIKGEA